MIGTTEKRNKRVNILLIIGLITMLIFYVTVIITKKVTIIIDNEIINHKTRKDKVIDILNELNITYSENDIISKDLNETIENKDEITIIRVDKREEYIMEEIPFQEEALKDYKTNVGETTILKEGSNGQKKIIYNVTYENGQEVKRELLREEIESEPVGQVISTGIFDPNSITTVVNKKRYLSQSFEPSDLVIPNVRMASNSSKNMMRSEAALELEKLFDAAEAEGVYLYAVSGYRSYYYQSTIYDPYSGYSAPPGTSEHQLGLAMDVNCVEYGTNLVTSFAYTKEGQWISNNSHKYGFIIRYLPSKEDITGYFYEPWHIRYLGVDLATELYNKGITLEEYYGEVE